MVISCIVGHFFMLDSLHICEKQPTLRGIEPKFRGRELYIQSKSSFGLTVTNPSRKVLRDYFCTKGIGNINIISAYSK